jgi:signal transduction histidine kinase
MGSLIERANRAGDDLRDLLASILETQRMDQGAEDFIPEPVSIVDALEAATRMIDPREGKTIERELRITVPPDTQIWGEKVRLQQILTNLLSNAIKYSEAGTAVEVVAQPVTAVTSEIFRWGRRTKTEEAMVEITVRDFGLGIPPEDATLLFQRFVRLPRDLASNVIGNGLGLHLCRIFAQAMGGTIWVESSGVEGEGSTFHLRLPAPPPLTAQHESTQAAPEIMAGAGGMFTHRQ